MGREIHITKITKKPVPEPAQPTLTFTSKLHRMTDAEKRRHIRRKHRNQQVKHPYRSFI